MSEQHQSGDDHNTSAWVIVGIALVVVGFFLGASNLGIVPWPMRAVWNTIVEARSGLGIILVGILLIIWAQSGHKFTAPARGRKLYRSRDDKWVAGVLGGLADYFGLEVTLLRLAFLVLVLGFDIGVLVAVYIVLMIVVPVEPEAGAPTAAAPVAAPATAPAPEPPAVTVPETPAAVPAPPEPVTFAGAAPAAPSGEGDGTEPPAGVTQA